jgi:hypothetical protein
MSRLLEQGISLTRLPVSLLLFGMARITMFARTFLLKPCVIGM